MNITAQLQDIVYHLPEQVLTNELLAREFPEWSVEKIAKKTGIYQRHVSTESEYSSTLAIKAAQKLLTRYPRLINQIDHIILCTQTPDYLLPTTACLIQHELGLQQSVCAFDINMGCSGYAYGLHLAKSLIISQQAETILLLTADTYSKLLAKDDKSVRTLFGDGASASLITKEVTPQSLTLGVSHFMTDGSGAPALIAHNSAMRIDKTQIPYLSMQGGKIFDFVLKTIPEQLQQLLIKAGRKQSDINQFVFHQANLYMLDCVRKKSNIPEDKFYIHLKNCGNTVSSSIPIALHHLLQESKKPLNEIILLGFGVGYSSGGIHLYRSQGENHVK